MAKRLDRFLVTDPLLETANWIRQWVGNFGDSDHNLILLQIAKGGEKPPSPFKFNKDWLKQSDFVELIIELWVPFDPGTRILAPIQFVTNIHRAK